ncbi:MAG: hypothetical protein LBQ31_09530 [Bacteroidales bacterium]|nr:hypothetical protein [Bacteroidales bacterium]
MSVKQYYSVPPPLAGSWRGRAFRCKVASKRGQRTRLRGLCRARATSLRSNNLFAPRCLTCEKRLINLLTLLPLDRPKPTACKRPPQQKGFPLNP